MDSSFKIISTWFQNLEVLLFSCTAWTARFQMRLDFWLTSIPTGEMLHRSRPQMSLCFTNVKHVCITQTGEFIHDIWGQERRSLTLQIEVSLDLETRVHWPEDHVEFIQEKGLYFVSKVMGDSSNKWNFLKIHCFERRVGDSWKNWGPHESADSYW